jgi:type II secretory pathway component PulF
VSQPRLQRARRQVAEDLLEGGRLKSAGETTGFCQKTIFQMRWIGFLGKIYGKP